MVLCLIEIHEKTPHLPEPSLPGSTRRVCEDLGFLKALYLEMTGTLSAERCQWKERLHQVTSVVSLAAGPRQSECGSPGAAGDPRGSCPATWRAKQRDRSSSSN